MTGIRGALVAYGLLVASTGLAGAAEPVKLRVADSFPKGHYLVKLVLEPWMEQVQKRTNNAVTFEHYPAQQLGKAAVAQRAEALRHAPHAIARGRVWQAEWPRHVGQIFRVVHVLRGACDRQHEWRRRERDD